MKNGCIKNYSMLFNAHPQSKTYLLHLKRYNSAHDQATLQRKTRMTHIFHGTCKSYALFRKQSLRDVLCPHAIHQVPNALEQHLCKLFLHVKGYKNALLLILYYACLQLFPGRPLFWRETTGDLPTQGMALFMLLLFLLLLSLLSLLLLLDALLDLCECLLYVAVVE